MQSSFSFLSPLATFHPLNLGPASPIKGNTNFWFESPISLPICSSFPAPSPPTFPSHFMSAQALLSWQSSEIALYQFWLFCTFLPGNSFNLLLSGFTPKALLKPFPKLLPVIKWMQQEEVTWCEELRVRGSGFLIWDPCYLAFWLAAINFTSLSESVFICSLHHEFCFRWSFFYGQPLYIIHFSFHRTSSKRP